MRQEGKEEGEKAKVANEGRDESDGCATQSPPSRASSTCCCWRATQPATTGTYIPGDESRPTERGREHGPLDTTPVGWLWHRARKPPARNPGNPRRRLAHSDPHVLYVWGRGGERASVRGEKGIRGRIEEERRGDMRRVGRRGVG